MLPPLQLSLGSAAHSDAWGGTTSGGGMGALNEGDWIIQNTGQGNNSAVPLPQGTGSWFAIAAAVAVTWFVMRR